MKRKFYLLVLTVLSINLIGCGAGSASTTGPSSVIGGGGSSETPKSGSRESKAEVLVPEAGGTTVYSNEDASIDASNATEGYVCVKYTGDSAKVRMLIETPQGNTYNYLMDLDGEYDVYPLSEGSGDYKIGVYENLHDDQYSMAFGQTITVELKDDISAFLYPNAYVNFTKDSKAVKKGEEIAQSCGSDLEMVEAVYHYIAKNITYDYDKAETVQSGYIPVVDETLESGKGICFDYASLMGTMLRSQGIPTRLDIGYAGTEYHAWISVYIKDTGWIDDIIEFDGTKWILMDPTLASYAKKSVIKDHWESDSYYQLKYKY